MEPGTFAVITSGYYASEATEGDGRHLMPSLQSARGSSVGTHSLAPWVWCVFVILIVATMLVCLPQVHYATALHDHGIPLDAFDHGIDVPVRTHGSLEVVVLGALYLVVLALADLSRHAREVAVAIASCRCVLTRPWSGGPDKARWRRRLSAPSGESDDDASNTVHTMLRMSTTLDPPRKLGSRGSLLFRVVGCLCEYFWFGAAGTSLFGGSAHSPPPSGVVPA